MIVIFYLFTLMPCCFKWYKNRKSLLRGKICWNLPLGFLRDSFSILSLCSLLNIYFISWATTQASVNSAFAITIIAILIIEPIVVAFFLYLNKPQLKHQAFKLKFEQAYPNLKDTENRFLLHPIFYLYRRILIPFCVIYFPEPLTT